MTRRGGRSYVGGEKDVGLSWPVRWRRGCLRLQVIVVFPWGHLNERVLQVGLARGLLHEPDLVEALSAYAAAEVGMELLEWDGDEGQSGTDS